MLEHKELTSPLMFCPDFKDNKTHLGGAVSEDEDVFIPFDRK